MSGVRSLTQTLKQPSGAVGWSLIICGCFWQPFGKLSALNQWWGQMVRELSELQYRLMNQRWFHLVEFLLTVYICFLLQQAKSLTPTEHRSVGTVTVAKCIQWDHLWIQADYFLLWGHRSAGQLQSWGVSKSNGRCEVSQGDDAKRLIRSQDPFTKNLCKETEQSEQLANEVSSKRGEKNVMMAMIQILLTKCLVSMALMWCNKFCLYTAINTGASPLKVIFQALL